MELQLAPDRFYILPPDVVLAEDNHAICPLCHDRIHCGPVGLGNLRKRHMDSKLCKETRAKKDKRKFKPMTLLGFLRPKPTPVPSTVSAPPPIFIATSSPVPLPEPTAPPRSSESRSDPSSLLVQLETAIKTLPATVCEARESDALAEFSQDPSLYLDVSIPPLEVFENLNPLFHRVLGWQMPVKETAAILRRGSMGLDGFLKFLTYFVQERGVREEDFGAKIQQILDAIAFLIPDPKPKTPTPLVAAPSMLTGTFASLKPMRTKSNLLRMFLRHRFIFPLRSGQTVSSAYPPMLHDKFNLSWDYAVKRGVLYLTAHTCSGERQSGRRNCEECAGLERNTFLKGIISRSQEGIHENTSLMFMPPAALVAIVQTKNEQISGLRMGVLNSSRVLLTQATALSDYKRFVVAIGSGKVQKVDRVVHACIRQKRGIRGMLTTYVRAAKGLYNAANSDEDDAVGVALMQLGAHRALGLPGLTTLRNRMITPPLAPSAGVPQVHEIQQNIDACFAGISDALARKRVVHQIVMWDEVATEKRVRHHMPSNKFSDRIGLEFNGEKDLDALCDALVKKMNSEGKMDSLVHIASETTVAAVGIMHEDPKFYAARPILISPDCKRETAQEHVRNVLAPVLLALKSKEDVTHLRTISISSDGETHRGSAFIIKTFKRTLARTSNIYPLLKDLKFMNFMVGDDDLTPDKDPKHVDKRLRNCLLRERGIRVLGIHLTPGIMRTHFSATGHTSDHIRSIFNPDDKQDVLLAFEMLKDIWSLPPCPPGTSPGISAARDALQTLGKLLYHFVSPYICVDFSLSEQLEHLSAAAHLALVLFRTEGKHFMASLLYTDIMLIIKNVYFCVAKAKVDDPLGKFWLILLGTDRLEQLFGLVRTMIGNDSNCDVLQLADRLRDSKILSEHSDHIKPSLVRGDMQVQEVTPLTCWNGGRRLVENECPWATAILQELDTTPGIDILSPFGKIVFDNVDPDDNEDEEVETTSGPVLPPHPLSTVLEDAAEEELEALIGAPQIPSAVSHSITVDGTLVRKSRALSQRLKYGQKGSTDRTRRVAGISRHSNSSILDSGMTEFDSIFVNAIHLDSESLDSLGFDVLPERTVTVSFQFLKIVPATSLDDVSNKHDWKSAGLLEQTLKVPGAFIQPLNPSLSAPFIQPLNPAPFYLFESSALRILTASLFEKLTPQNQMLLATVSSTKFFPYRERGGGACFVCEFNDNSQTLETPNSCTACPPNTPLDPKQGQPVLAHNCAHILFDPAIDRSTQRCGMCLNPAPFCQYFLTTSGTKKIDYKRSKCPNARIKYSYSIAGKSAASSPCSNIPINCALCGTEHPAVWRYNYLDHLHSAHPTAPVEKYRSIWELSQDEKNAMEVVWKARKKGVPIPKKRESKNVSLAISEAHSSRLSMT
ncbi:hypothetical protein C8J57DRAFT_1455782 [Mycena rebaudengoi]|nr:hypothetical protein C8J57DRAFT_1455782 [Mycena rebaudengoi]